MENEIKIDPMFKEIVERALNNDHQPFEFIGNLTERSVAKTCVSATKKIIKLFRQLEENSAYTYVDLIKRGKQSSEILLAHIQFKQCVKFYEKELETLKDMLKEYRAYFWAGHVFSSLLGFYRKDEDKVDYRKLPWSWF